MSGLELVRKLHVARPRLPIFMMTAHGTTETAIEATQSGAYDYLLKPFEMPELLKLVDQAVAASRLMSEPVQIGEAVQSRDAIVGNSRAMQAIYKEIGRIAAKPVSVLIRGETGTGKELIARAIYQHSDRANAPFVAINCAAIPETLLESELFGHERGAFTGAEARRIGRFEQADHGTIFLDEIGDMTPGTQVKLMRVLQEKCLQRLGGKETSSRGCARHRRDASRSGGGHQAESISRRSLLSPQRRGAQSAAVARTQGGHPGSGPVFLAKIRRRVRRGKSRHPSGRGGISAGPAVARQCARTGKCHAQDAVAGAELHHQRRACPGGARQNQSAGIPGDKSLQAYADELIAAAQRGELTDAHARLHETAERVLFSRAIELAHGNQAKAARWLGISRLTLREKLIQFGLHPGQE